MAAAVPGLLLNTLRSTYKHAAGYNVHPAIFLQTREYAARKGTREKARKKKVKVVVQKVGFMQRVLKKAEHHKETAKKVVQLHLNEHTRMKPVDNVWVTKFFHWKVYSFEEAVTCHRETHDPTMYNLPKAPISALIDLNMMGEKKNKVIDPFKRIVGVPHKFQQMEDRSVLAFCNTVELQEIATKAGANVVGGRELIKQIQAGELALRNYDYHVAHVNIMSDLLLIRGLMKRRFPNAKQGTLGEDIKELVERFKLGVKYTVQSHENQKQYGFLEVVLGTLDMDTKKLEENFISILEDLESVRPKREGPFILRARLNSPPSRECLKIDISKYVPEESDTEEKAEEEEEDTDAAVIATH